MVWEKKGECVKGEELKRGWWGEEGEGDEKLEGDIERMGKVVEELGDYGIWRGRGGGYYVSGGWS